MFGDKGTYHAIVNHGTEPLVIRGAILPANIKTSGGPIHFVDCTFYGPAED